MLLLTMKNIVKATLLLKSSFTALPTPRKSWENGLFST
ncbi:hypothetical protein J2Z66_004657 [Paenibacillus eucommiae]|uniref:Uncharacterized protein n=1 Tax=Paenibacillus eucommiae TaxID=1355755 RepID=A0ABS4J143_9BACL|nr:hypothetical protein [Paenibacillus eucommiae]